MALGQDSLIHAHYLQGYWKTFISWNNSQDPLLWLLDSCNEFASLISSSSICNEFNSPTLYSLLDISEIHDEFTSLTSYSDVCNEFNSPTSYSDFQRPPIRSEFTSPTSYSKVYDEFNSPTLYSHLEISEIHNEFTSLTSYSSIYDEFKSPTLYSHLKIAETHNEFTSLTSFSHPQDLPLTANSTRLPPFQISFPLRFCLSKLAIIPSDLGTPRSLSYSPRSFNLLTTNGQWQWRIHTKKCIFSCYLGWKTTWAFLKRSRL